jgi:hypothetical protein
LEFHGDAPFNHPYSMHSANERQPTLVTRARAQSFPYFLSCAAKD